MKPRHAFTHSDCFKTLSLNTHKNIYVIRVKYEYYVYLGTISIVHFYTFTVVKES